jgi:hypothetical protein
MLIKELGVKELQKEVGELADFSWITRYERVLLIAGLVHFPSLYGDVECGVEDSKEVVDVASQLKMPLKVSRNPINTGQTSNFPSLLHLPPNLEKHELVFIS